MLKIIFKKIMMKLRLWRYLFKKIGKDVFIAKSVIIYRPENIKVGNNVVINEGVLLNARASIEIGHYVHISPYVIINTGGLDYRKVMAERAHFDEPVAIEDGVWVGSGAIINPGIAIGKNSVIGAGAVVVSDIPADSVAVGVPAKVVKKINE